MAVLRSWLVRTGVVLAVSLAAMTGLVTPAHAEIESVRADSYPSTAKKGDTIVVAFFVKADANVDPENPENKYAVEAREESPRISCLNSSQCNFGLVKFVPGEEKRFEARFVVSGNPENGEKATFTLIGGDESDGFQITLQADQQEPQYIGKIQGQVKDSLTNKAISGASVVLSDGNSSKFTTSTDSNGAYLFDGAKDKIVPGRIFINVTKDPYQQVIDSYSFDLGPGQSKTDANIVMENPTATATPTVTPSVTATPDPSTSNEPAPAPPAGEDSGLGSLTLLMIIVGGLLVALGIGAIVLLLVRRGGDEEDDEDEAGEPLRPSPRGPAGAAAATRPGAPGGTYGGVYGRPADPTMLGGPAAEAPTMMHRPAADQYGVPQQRPPQAYGSPAGTPAPGAAYGSPAGQSQWAPGTPAGYGSPAAYGSPVAPAGDGGYGAQPGYGQAGYEQQPGYDPQAGYDAPATYGGAQPGYEAPAGYQTQGGYSGGYAGQEGYSPDPYQQGDPGQPQDPYGTGQQPGYQADPYGSQPGYPQDPYNTGQQPGYEDDRRRDRRLDWLDD